MHAIVLAVLVSYLSWRVVSSHRYAFLMFSKTYLLFASYAIPPLCTKWKISSAWLWTVSRQTLRAV